MHLLKAESFLCSLECSALFHCSVHLQQYNAVMLMNVELMQCINMVFVITNINVQFQCSAFSMHVHCASERYVLCAVSMLGSFDACSVNIVHQYKVR